MRNHPIDNNTLDLEVNRIHALTRTMGRLVEEMPDSGTSPLIAGELYALTRAIDDCAERLLAELDAAPAD